MIQKIILTTLLRAVTASALLFSAAVSTSYASDAMSPVGLWRTIDDEEEEGGGFALEGRGAICGGSSLLDGVNMGY